MSACMVEKAGSTASTLVFVYEPTHGRVTRTIQLTAYPIELGYVATSKSTVTVRTHTRCPHPGRSGPQWNPGAAFIRLGNGEQLCIEDGGAREQPGDVNIPFLVTIDPEACIIVDPASVPGPKQGTIRSVLQEDDVRTADAGDGDALVGERAPEIARGVNVARSIHGDAPQLLIVRTTTNAVHPLVRKGLTQQAGNEQAIRNVNTNAHRENFDRNACTRAAVQPHITAR